MSDERLLRALGKLAREQDAGEVPDAWMAPPTAAAKQRVLEGAMKELAGGSEKAVGPVVPRTEAARVTGTPLRRSRRWLAGAVPMAMAVAAVLILARPQDDDGALPAYSLELSGGFATERSAHLLEPAPAAAPLVLQPGAPLRVLLRPATASKESKQSKIDGRVFFVRDGRAVAWLVRPERSDEGALLFDGPADRPFGPGAGELLIVVGPTDALPDEAKALDAAPAGVQTFRRPLHWP